MPLPDWETVNAVPPLAAGEVHVWQDDLHDETPRAWMAGELSATDAERADRFRVPERRRAFVRGRLLTRYLVAHYLARPMQSVSIDVGDNDKPFVRREGGDAEIDVSVSHSGRVLLIAISRAGAVGVDAERLDSGLQHESIARRFFAPEERDALAAYAPVDRARAFFRCWTRKEAVVKAIGAGLAVTLSDFVVSAGDTVTSPLLRVAPEWTHGANWQLHDMATDADYMGALAVSGTGVVVRRLRLVP